MLLFVACVSASVLCLCGIVRLVTTTLQIYNKKMRNCLK